MIRIACGRCPFCRQESFIDLEDEELALKVLEVITDPHRTYLQVALPELTDGQREQLITGTHEACFDAAFPEEDEIGG